MDKKGSRLLYLWNRRKPQDISYAEWNLLLIIADSIDNKTGYGWPKVEWLADAMGGVTERYTTQLIWQLETKGYLRVYERKGYRKTYYIVPPLRDEKLPETIKILETDVIEELWTIRTPLIHKQSTKQRRTKTAPYPQPLVESDEEPSTNGHDRTSPEALRAMAAFMAVPPKSKGRRH